MRGGYTLIINVPRKIELTLKSIGHLSLDPGKWVYVGSAMGTGSTNLENRIKRHFRAKKRTHWHIDYLLQASVQLLSAIWVESQESVECRIARKLEKQVEFEVGPKKFGASDCIEGCFSHLFHAQDDIDVEFSILKVFKKLKLKPRITYDGEISNSTGVASVKCKVTRLS